MLFLALISLERKLKLKSFENVLRRAHGSFSSARMHLSLTRGEGGGVDKVKNYDSMKAL